MKKITITMLILLFAAMSAEAKNWKIGPSSVTGMDFASINAAMSSSDVKAGDTLYLDQYYNESAEQTVTKKVTIIGTGYDISLTDEQVVARLTNTLHLKSNGAIIRSVYLKNVYFYSGECTIDRCYVNYITAASEISSINHIYSSYIEGNIVGYNSNPYTTKIDIQNCVVTAYAYNYNLISRLTSSIINNNVIDNTESYAQYACLENITNSQITNNLIHGVYGNDGRNIAENVSSSGSGNSIEHNITCGAAMTYYPNNKYGYKDRWYSLFVNVGNYSAKYELAKDIDDNPAIGYATDGGDCGCHGGMFGCPSGGRPQYIPYFTKVTVGSRSENGKLPVSVSIKIQDE